MKFQLTLALALTIFHGPYAASHHSMVAFDPSKRVNVAGVVTKLEWSNPHVRLYVKEQGDEAGVATEWEFELPSVNHLIRQGWSRHAINVGDRVVVMAARARLPECRLRADRHRFQWQKTVCGDGVGDTLIPIPDSRPIRCRYETCDAAFHIGNGAHRP